MTRSNSFVWIARVLTYLTILTAVGWVATKINFRLVIHEIQIAPLSGMVAMVITWCAFLFVRPLRLLYLLRSVTGVRITHPWTVWSAYTIGTAANGIAPMRAGDLIIIFILRRRLKIAGARAFSIIVFDRLFDFATATFVFLGALWFAPLVAPWATRASGVLLCTLVTCAAGALTMYQLRRSLLGLIGRFVERLNPDRRARWDSTARELLSSSLAVIGQPYVIGVSTLLSSFLWALAGLSYWFGIAAVWPTISPAAVGFALATVSLSFVVPLSPAGIGVFQAATVVSLAAFGVPLEPALAFAIIAHALQLVSTLAYAAASMFIQKIDIRSPLTGEAS